MKKTALTFGLFSLVMVATSFAAPSNVSSNNNIAQVNSINPDGSVVGGNKKLDVTLEISKKNSINPDGSVVGGNKKLD
jgi:hypothetical protein